MSLRERDPQLCSTTRVASGWSLMLALYLSQKILIPDAMETQNFFTLGVGNATANWFQLNEDGFFNAFGLKQLEEFFESIERVDLAFVIHEFLLGDYNWLRQIPEVANQATSFFHFPSPSVMAGVSDSHDRS